MNLSYRHRVGLILAGLVIGAPLVGASAANAATTTITFSGQPLLGSTLSCPSTPSQTTLNVTAGTTVNFVNQTGRTATLWAGDAEKSLPDKSLVPVTFNGGPSSIVIQMLPACSLDLGKHIQMTVNVTAPGGAKPTPSVTSGGGSIGGTASPRSTPSSAATQATAKADPTKSSGAAVTTTASPPDDSNPFAPSPVLAATKPLIGDAVAPVQPHSTSGLLTLIATVGVVGVSAAAIRAIVAQRSTRVVSA